MHIYNSMTRREEPFVPIRGNRVKMFVCGPTVYDDMHLGHARTYLAYDIIARFLRRAGYSLFYLMNITDVDDKIIQRASELRRDPLSVAREYERRFSEDLESLGITSVNLFARATEHVEEMIEQISVLIKKGFAYETETGVYYDVTKFPHYGELSHQDPSELIKHRVDPDPTKRHVHDFALWKKRPREEFGWNSPWGYGRPGWHIEDTAITVTYFGPTYDIHGGAIELIFPHHEAEIAQAEAFTGERPLVKYWTHTGLLTVDGEKMSKSLGNFITVREILSRYEPGVIRFYLASSHYRSPIDFKEENVAQAEQALESLRNAIDNLETIDVTESVEDSDLKFLEKARAHREEFMRSMCSDFNTPSAIAALFAFASEINRFLEREGRLNANVKNDALAILHEMTSILGIKKYRRVTELELTELYDLIRLLIDVRDALRRERKYELADEIRGRLEQMGIELEDTAGGTRWRIAGRPSSKDDDRNL
ncbi:MAG: cysteine--tRNA ligase [Aigarchaeota archaeon]|nr:cysteine--tRNA ligase [Aigarchaeota archaeon]MDW8092320.1 cysteine--tRNA ligase [Nitrososphaerota archaeon]